MFNRTTKNTLTGPDVIIVMAEAATEHGDPYGALFSMLVQEMLVQRPGGPLFGHEAVATSQLEDYEDGAARVVAAAAHYAFQQKDWVMLREVATFGANALARWPRFLASTADGHPAFELKPVPFEVEDE